MHVIMMCTSGVLIYIYLHSWWISVHAILINMLFLLAAKITVFVCNVPSINYCSISIFYCFDHFSRILYNIIYMRVSEYSNKIYFLKMMKSGGDC